MGPRRNLVSWPGSLLANLVCAYQRDVCIFESARSSVTAKRQIILSHCDGSALRRHLLRDDKSDGREMGLGESVHVIPRDLSSAEMSSYNILCSI